MDVKVELWSGLFEVRFWWDITLGPHRKTGSVHNRKSLIKWANISVPFRDWRYKNTHIQTHTISVTTDREHGWSSGLYILYRGSWITFIACSCVTSFHLFFVCFVLFLFLCGSSFRQRCVESSVSDLWLNIHNFFFPLDGQTKIPTQTATSGERNMSVLG